MKRKKVSSSSSSSTPAIDRLIAAIPRNADPVRMREALAMKDRAQELARTMRASRSLPVVYEVAAETGRRVDQAIAGVLVMSPTKPACARGCAYCCHIEVTVRAPEVFRALASVPPEKIDGVAKRAAENAARIEASDAYPSHMPCALLEEEDGACLAYDARPVLCRTEHSYDMHACKRVFESGTDEKVLRNSDLSGKAALQFIPFGQAIDTVFPGSRGLELQSAIHIALSTPDAASRWLAGADVFEKAAVESSDAW